MLSTTCGTCGAVTQLDESQVPPSGLVSTCASCGKPITITPPGQGLFDEEAPTRHTPASEDIIDLPAPKTLGGKVQELPDLLTPVGPRPRARSEVPDLLAPVGPTSRKQPPPAPPAPRPAQPPAPRPPPPPSDLLAPVSPSARPASNSDLLTPVGPTSSRQSDVTDLLTPVGPTSLRQSGVTDLLTPVGPTSRHAPDLLTPVGPTGRGSATDLLTPVGPTGRGSATDLLTPVGPTASGLDLLTPVGPTSRNAPDLLTPVGPEPIRNAPGLLTPVGPESIRNAPDMLTPVGPEPIRNMPMLPTPVGPVPTRGVDLPAPKGFFDEAPPPRSAGASRQMPPLMADDDLDVVPAGSFANVSSIDLGPPSSPATAVTTPPFSMDGLALGEEQQQDPSATSFDTGMAYGDVDLPSSGQAPNEDGIVSFSRPTGGKATEAAAAAGRSIDLASAPRKKPGTIATDRASASATVAAPATDQGVTPKKKPLRRGPVLAAVAFAVLAAGGYYTYSSVELTMGSFQTLPARERRDRIAAGLASVRKLMRSDDPGHWKKAIDAAEKVIPLVKGRASDLLGLVAQGHLASVFDEGLHIQADRDAAEALVSDLMKSGAKEIEVDKALALRSALDQGRANDALTQLETVARRAANDPDLALYTGWVALEARQWGKAKGAFTKALQLTPNRQAALLGLGKALMALGEGAKAKETFQKVFDRPGATKHYGAWLAITELTTEPHDAQGLREKELGVLCERAPERETAHPRDRSRAWTLYGDEALFRGRYDVAAERYRIARELDPRNVAAMVGRATATIELRTSATAAPVSGMSLAETRRELEQALYIEPQNVLALVGMTRVSLLDGKVTDARKHIDAALTIDEKNAKAHYWRGKVLEEPTMNQAAAAEQDYQRAIELAPQDYAAFVALSQLYLARAQELERENRKPDAAAVRAKAVTILQPVADAAKTDAPMANVLGTVYRAAHDNVAAEKWFRDALAVDAANVDARLNLAATLESAGRASEAVVEYRAAYAAAPKREDVVLGLAGILERTHDLATAEGLYQGLLSTAGGVAPTAGAHAAAGRYYARRGRLDLARAEGDVLSAMDPQNPATYYLQGVGMLADGKLNDAMKLLKMAVALDPQAQYNDTIGLVAEQMGALGEAQIAYEQAIRLDPGYAPPMIGLGRVHLLRRQFALALPVLDRASRLVTDNADIWFGIGLSHSELGHLSEAVAAFNMAIKYDDKNPETYFRLGTVYQRLNQPNEVVSSLRHAIANARSDTPWLVEAWRMLGFGYRATGNHSEMCEAFRQYLILAPATELMLRDVKREHAGCPN